MSQDMNFTKIKRKSGKLTIKWKTPVPGDHKPNETQIKSEVAPHPDFRQALQDLAPHFKKMLDKGVELTGKLVITGIEMDRSEKGKLAGAILTAHVSVATTNNPLVLNTPAGARLPEGAHEPIEKLCKEAREFVYGKNGEDDLFTEAEGDGAIEEAEVKQLPSAETEAPA